MKKLAFFLVWAILIEGIFVCPAFGKGKDLPDTAQFLPTWEELKTLTGLGWKKSYYDQDIINERVKDDRLLEEVVMSQRYYLWSGDDIGYDLTLQISYFFNLGDLKKYYQWEKKLGYEAYKNVGTLNIGDKSFFIREEDFFYCCIKSGNYYIHGDGVIDFSVLKAILQFVVSQIELSTGIIVESNPYIKKMKIPYKGVVADGASYLEISFNLPSVSEVKIIKPPFVQFEAEEVSGKTKGEKIGENEAIQLINGRAKIRLIPPKYIGENLLTEKIDIKKNNNRVAEVWAVSVPLNFRYKTPEGREKSQILEIFVCRSPVMLVHGFLGDKTTWSKFESYLKKRKFDPHNGEYYRGDQSIIEQAVLLGTFIQNQKKYYRKAGIKVKKVDVVAHSTGGLFARYYTKGYYKYKGDIRKIIMVGTPNHGISRWSTKVGAFVLSEWKKKHTIAAAELHSNSSFVTNLNAGEKTGKHLREDGQYANIIGKVVHKNVYFEGPLPNTEEFQDVMLPEDGVITYVSSHLDYVIEYVFLGKKHSPDLFTMPGVGLTVAKDVWDKIIELLLHDIPCGK
jgi:hypothetical protein